MDWFDIYALDVLEAQRSLQKRLKKHPFFALWFMLLSFGFIWFMLRIYTFSLDQVQGGLFADISPSSLLFLLFIIFFAKSVSDSSRKMIQNKSLVFDLSQPIRQSQVLFGKMFSEMVFNLSLIVMTAAIVVLNVLVFDYPLAGDYWFFLNSLLIVVFATVIGTLFTIFNTFPLKKRAKLLLALTPSLALFYSVLFSFSIEGIQLFFVFLILTLSSLALVLLGNRVFLEAWTQGINLGRSVKTSRFSRKGGAGVRFLGHILSAKQNALIQGEISKKLRTKEFIGTMITIVAISYGSLYIASDYNRQEFLGMRFGFLFIPMVVGLGIFASALLEPGISQLSSIGQEGKNMWILKSSPLSGATIVQSKAMANMISAPIIVAGPGVFVTLYSGYSAYAALFSALGALTLVFLFTGIGAWFGTKYVNFDESVKGYPDIMTLYIYAMVCLVFAVIFLSVPLGVYLFDKFLGILTLILSVDMAALILYLGTYLGGAELDRLEVV